MSLTPALVFDLDGTLVDTAPDLLRALNAVLVREGRREVGRADLRHLVGHGARAMLAEAMVRTGAPAPTERLHALTDAFIVHYGEHIADKSRPFPGVDSTLAALTKYGARMGVLTNKPQELAMPLLEKLHLARYFGAILGAGRFSYAKPDPRVFHQVVDELGGVGAGAVMIGDSTTDAAAARAATVPAILVSYGYSPEPVEMLGADAVIDAFGDLLPAVRHILRDSGWCPKQQPP